MGGKPLGYKIKYVDPSPGRKYKKALYDIGFNRVEANESRFKKTREVLSNIKDVKYHSLEDFYIISFMVCICLLKNM